MILIDDCYNANPMSMRAALDDLAADRRAAGSARRVAVLGDMLELGPGERELPRRDRRARRRAADVDVLVTVGPLAAAMTDRFDGESYPVADAGEAAALLPELLAPGDAVLVKASRGVGLEVVCRHSGGRRMTWRHRCGGRGRVTRLDSGRVLIAGTASLLICLFLARSSSSSCAQREFGQNIREEGPQGHHTKAGTPTMGGIIIFLAIAVPFLILSTRDWQSLGVFGAAVACALLGFADDYTKIVKPPLAGAAGAHQAGRHDRDLARPVVGRDPEGRHQHRPSGCASSTPAIDLGPLLPAVHLPGGGGHDQRGQPDRRPRRPGGRLRRDRAAGLHRDHVHHRRAARPDVAGGLPGGGVHRLSVVQQLPGEHLHGGHGARWDWAARSPVWRS